MMENKKYSDLQSYQIHNLLSEITKITKVISESTIFSDDIKTALVEHVNIVFKSYHYEWEYEQLSKQLEPYNRIKEEIKKDMHLPIFKNSSNKPFEDTPF